MANRDHRKRRAARDDPDDDDSVGVYRRTKWDTYAYYELDDEFEPRCPTRSPTKAQKFEILTRRGAKSLGKAPAVTADERTEMWGAIKPRYSN